MFPALPKFPAHRSEGEIYNCHAIENKANTKISPQPGGRNILTGGVSHRSQIKTILKAQRAAHPISFHGVPTSYGISSSTPIPHCIQHERAASITPR